MIAARWQTKNPRRTPSSVPVRWTVYSPSGDFLRSFTGMYSKQEASAAASASGGFLVQTKGLFKPSKTRSTA